LVDVLVRDVMSTTFTSIREHTTMREAAAIMSARGISDVVVADESGGLAGVLPEGDLLRAVTPGIDDLSFISDGSLMEAFDLLVVNGRHVADQPVARLVIRDPIIVAPEDPVLKAVTVMLNMHIHGLPVVSDGQVVGTISRADICRGLLRPATAASASD
jgi:CBS domain-containing protein